MFSNRPSVSRYYFWLKLNILIFGIILLLLKGVYDNWTLILLVKLIKHLLSEEYLEKDFIALKEKD